MSGLPKTPVGKWGNRTGLLLVCATISASASAKPPCVEPEASNFVLGSLTTRPSGPWLLQRVNSSKRFVMRRCSASKESECYFATDVEPGRYYFRELLMGVNNSLDYPVSKPALWIDVTGQGIDYIGNWIIDRGDRRVVDNLQITYKLDKLDEMIALCQISGKRLFLDQTRTKPREIVD